MSGLLPPPQFLPTPGEPSRPWVQWYRLFENYLVAAALEAAAAGKKAILLHCLGTEGQRIFYTLPTPPSSNLDVYKKTVKALEGHFLPTVNVVAERYKFRQRAQLPGESIDAFISSLRELASTCDFDTFQDEMLRDQLVEKITSPKLRERLLLEPRLTLTRALEVARNYEQAQSEARSMTLKQSAAFTTSQVRDAKPPTSGQTRKCFRCGSGKHLANSSECKAVQATCRACQKKGHFEKMCLGRNKVRSVEATTTAPTTTTAAITPTTTTTVQPQVLHTENVFNVHAKHRPNVNCNVLINNVSIHVVVDTASDVTLMNLTTFEKYFVKEALTPCKTSMKAYTNTEISLVGCFDANISFQDRSARIVIHVVREGTTLIGKNAIQLLHLQIDGASLSCFTTSDADLPSVSTAPSEFPSLFSDNLGLIKGYQHKIKLKLEARRVQQKLRPLPFAAREKVSRELARLEQDGVIEKAPDATE